MVFKFYFQFSVIFRPFRGYCSKGSIMKVLNVAEKNDAAKNIAFFLSNGNSQRKEGFSKFNKIYEFQCNVLGQNRQMVMTSVSGHLLALDFISAYKNWTGCSPEALFEAPVVKFCPENFAPIKRTLEREIKSCDTLIIWTDCDREGENIGYEVITTCRAVKPNIRVFRAIFSEITGPSIKRAIQNLGQPNKSVSDAVEVRSELDLRIGASFTRFQTLRLQRVFPPLAEYLLSYGSCQFPTLGFVVERYLEREKFIPEPFWRIKVTHTIDDLTVEFRWQRDRLFDERICEALLLRCRENPIAKVEKVEGKPKSKWRPTPLDTTEMEKIASRKLRLNAKETLKTAEKLYTQGYISYPRTETNIFPSSINLSSLVELQVDDPRWGNFARKVLDDGPNPRQGKKSDQSHPPIHPTKHANNLQGNEAKVYELVVRHFLACVSKDAKAHETTVVVDINTEKFTASGLMILEKNYLEVYWYESWNSKAIHLYKLGETFEPTILEMVSSQTSAPNLLTEADLISLMEKHGIGTDATHADHIETIKSRMYVGLEDNIHFVPSAVGMGLVEGYNSMGFEMSKPKYRAELEAELKRICDGVRQPQDVLREQVIKYKTLFQKAKEQVIKIDAAIGKYIQSNAVALNPDEDPLGVTMQTYEKVMPCQKCGIDMTLRKSSETNKYNVSCMGFPHCRNSIWLPNKVLEAKVSDQSCFTCGPAIKMIDFKFKPGSMVPYYPDHFIGCINGCEPDFLEMLEVRIPPRNSEGSNVVPSNSLNNTAPRNQPRNDSSNNTAPRNQPRQQQPFGVPNGSGFQMHSNFPSSSNTQRRSPGNNSGRGGVDQGRGQKRPREGPSDDNEVVCLCNQPAKRLTVRKEGPNLGREFLVCSKDSDDKCSYYSWADELSDVKCMCNITAKKLTVRKEGPNQGRQFFTCPKPQNERCVFFLWDEEGGDTNSGNQQFNANPRQQQNQWGNNRGRNRNQPQNNTFRARGNAQPSTRKCGQCGQPGHTRRNCPQNND